MIQSRYCTFLVYLHQFDVKYIESQEWEAFLDTHEELLQWLHECLGPGVREYDGNAEQGEHAGLDLDKNVRIDNTDTTVVIRASNKFTRWGLLREYEIFANLHLKL